MHLTITNYALLNAVFVIQIDVSLSIKTHLLVYIKFSTRNEYMETSK